LKGCPTSWKKTDMSTPVPGGVPECPASTSLSLFSGAIAPFLS